MAVGLEGEPGLAGAAGTGEGDKARSLLDLGEELGELLLAAEEGARGAGQVRVRDRLQRGEALFSQLVDGDRLGDVLEAVLAQIGEDEAGDGVAGGAGQDDLAAVAARGDPCCEVELSAHVARLGQEDRPRVQAHAHAYGSFSERFLGGEGCGYGIFCLLEDDEEGVALGIHLHSPVR